MSNSELSDLCGSRASVFREPCKDWGVASHSLAEVIQILWVSKLFFLDKTIQKCSHEQKADQTDRTGWVPFVTLTCCVSLGTAPTLYDSRASFGGKAQIMY